jgi:phage regulator Rha-like protein
MKKESIIPAKLIEQRIFMIRGQKVMLDFHLAEIYGVPTKSLNLAVRRNINRFPSDFVFKITKDEFDQVKEFLRFQSETSNSGRGGRRYLPYAFTEHGAIMLASVLNSPRAVQASIYVVRAFVRLREFLSTHKELAQKLTELERRIGKHDKAIQAIVETIRQLMRPPEKPKRKIGFRVEEKRKHYRTK